jgi:hypothetical protein
VLLDEAVFTFNTYASRAWYLNKESLLLPEKRFQTKTLSLILAISNSNGIEHFRIHKKPISRKEYLEFISELAELNDNKPFGIFMDNMRVHHSKVAEEAYKNLNIMPVFNIPYCP